ncbi:hypothetical protein HDV03_004250 [Kappamyces sp. JEL0829]|nr:hypothetical protein HDV03_004250 [Kappamyces sp. JEL0829]
MSEEFRKTMQRFSTFDQNASDFLASDASLNGGAAFVSAHPSHFDSVMNSARSVGEPGPVSPLHVSTFSQAKINDLFSQLQQDLSPAHALFEQDSSDPFSPDVFASPPPLSVYASGALGLSHDQTAPRFVPGPVAPFGMKALGLDGDSVQASKETQAALETFDWENALKRDEETRAELDKLRIQTSLLLQENSQLRSRLLSQYRRTSMQNLKPALPDDMAAEKPVTQQDLVSDWLLGTVGVYAGVIREAAMEEKEIHNEVRVVFDEEKPVCKDVEIQVDFLTELSTQAATQLDLLAVQEDLELIQQGDLSLAWMQASVNVVKKESKMLLEKASRDSLVTTSDAASELSQVDVNMAWVQGSLLVSEQKLVHDPAAPSQSDRAVQSPTSLYEDQADNGMQSSVLSQSDLTMAWMQGTLSIASSLVRELEQTGTQTDPIAGESNDYDSVQQHDLSLAWLQGTIGVAARIVKDLEKKPDQKTSLDISLDMHSVQQSDLVSAWLQGSLQLALTKSLELVKLVETSSILPQLALDTAEMDLSTLETAVARVESLAAQPHQDALSSEAFAKFERSVEFIEQLSAGKGLSDGMDREIQTARALLADAAHQTEAVSQEWLDMETIIERIEQHVQVDSISALDANSLETLVEDVERLTGPGSLDATVQTVMTTSEVTVQTSVVRVSDIESQTEQGEPESVVLSPHSRTPTQESVQTDTTLDHDFHTRPKRSASISSTNATLTDPGQHLLDINVAKIGDQAKAILKSRRDLVKEFYGTTGIEEACLHIITALLEWGIYQQDNFEMNVGFGNGKWTLKQGPFDIVIPTQEALEYAEAKQKWVELEKEWQQERTLLEDMILLQMKKNRSALRS